MGIQDHKPVSEKGQTKSYIAKRVSARKILEKKITEKAFLKLVIDFAKWHGWLVFHARPAMDSKGRWKTPVMADGAGFVDLVMARWPSVIFVELKTDSGALTAKQEKWLLSLAHPNHQAFVWRPSDWPEIEEVLK